MKMFSDSIDLWFMSICFVEWHLSFSNFKQVFHCKSIFLLLHFLVLVELFQLFPSGIILKIFILAKV